MFSKSVQCSTREICSSSDAVGVSADGRWAHSVRTCSGRGCWRIKLLKMRQFAVESWRAELARSMPSRRANFYRPSPPTVRPPVDSSLGVRRPYRLSATDRRVFFCLPPSSPIDRSSRLAGHQSRKQKCLPRGAVNEPLYTPSCYATC